MSEGKLTRSLRMGLLAALLLTVAPLKAEKVFTVTPSTFASSLKKAMKAFNGQREDVTMIFQDGVYTLDAPLLLNLTSKNGKGGRLTLKAAEGAKPVLSGGKRISNWTQVAGRLWKTDFSYDQKLRQLFVNGKRARMAQASIQSQGCGKIENIAISGQESWAFGAGTGVDAIKLKMNPELHLFKNAEDVELVQNKVWTEKILCVRDLDKWGDTLIVKLQQPAGAILNSMAWAGKIDYEKLFFVRNAYELLDEPGEFYFDRKAQTLYYMARNGEDMRKAEIVAPITEGLIRIHGKSISERVENITLQGLTFQHDAWNLMEVEGSRGFGGIQSLGLAVKYIPDGNWHPTKYNSSDTPMGTIDVQNATGIRIIRCRFEHLGSASAVTLLNDVCGSEVTGCFFNDLLGNSVTVGHPQHYEIGDGEGRYSPSVEGVCHDIVISNNYVRNVCLDFRQAEAMVGFFVNGVRFLRNDIQGVPYGAIALGWWWGNAKIPESKVAGNNVISFNRLGNTHQLLSDGGIVYMLGRQPGSVMEGNYLFRGPRCIYPDDGSSGWYIHDNVVRSRGGQLWLHIDSDRDYDIRISHNYVNVNTLANSGVNTPVEDTQVFRNRDFNDEAKAIMDASGIEAAFQDIIPAEEPAPISIIPQFKISKW